jgi:uncharacterized alkaline shock family protein YloU
MTSEIFKNIDVKEIELPNTDFIFDIETKVLQGICYQCIKHIEGLHPLEAGLIDNLLGHEQLKGIYVQQDSKQHAVLIKLEVGVTYGVCLPSKAEALQTIVVKEISELTGLHVGSVHVVFKNLVVKHQDVVKL